MLVFLYCWPPEPLCGVTGWRRRPAVPSGWPDAIADRKCTRKQTAPSLSFFAFFIFFWSLAKSHPDILGSACSPLRKLFTVNC